MAELKISTISQKYPTFEGAFFHIVTDRNNTKLEFLYIVGYALKSFFLGGQNRLKHMKLL